MEGEGKGSEKNQERCLSITADFLRCGRWTMYTSRRRTGSLRDRIQVQLRLDNADARERDRSPASLLYEYAGPMAIVCRQES